MWDSLTIYAKLREENYMKKKIGAKEFTSKFLNSLGALFLVFSMFSFPLITTAETREGVPSTGVNSTDSEVVTSGSTTAVNNTEANVAGKSDVPTTVPYVPKAVDDVITSVRYTSNEGRELNWSLEPWATFKINATFALPNNKVHAGDTTTVEVPSKLIINSSDFALKGKDKNGNEQIAAYAHVDPTYKKLTLTYTDFVENNSDVKGSFFFYVRVDHQLVPNAEKIPISLIVENKVVPNDNPQPPVNYIGVKEPELYTLNKVGSYNREATNPTLNYTIAINRKPLNIKNAVLKDTLQFTNASYDRNSFIVEKGQWVWEDANWVFKDAQPANYEISYPDDKSFVIKIANITDKEMYRIRYNVTLGYVPRDNEKFVNNATLNGEDSVVKTAEAKILWQKGGGSVEGYVYHIKLHKQNESGEPLQGAQFKIVRNANKQTITHEIDGKQSEIFTSDKDGNVNVTDLLKDDYTIMEVAAPNGYQLLKDPVTISEADFSQGNPNFDVSSKILTVTIRNKRQNSRQLKVTKTWNDKDDQYKNRPSSVTVNLLKDGVVVEGKNLVLSTANNWSGAFTDLDETGTYSVQEVGVTGYVATIETKAKDSIRVVNNLETTEVSGTKTWNDDNNREGKRPNHIIVNLFANGEKVDTVKVKSNKEGNWTYSFKNLPKYKEGQEIVYTISEEAVDGYTSQIEGTNLINTYIPTRVTIPFIKVWKDNDNQNGLRPDSIIVHLLANGKIVANKTLTAETGWKGDFENLPKYKEGQEIVYTLQEERVANYTTNIDQKNFIITNTLKPEETYLTVTKRWEDENDKDGLRPKMIKIQLYANGKKTGEEIELSETNKWTYTFSNLPKNDNENMITYTVREVEVPKGYEMVEEKQDTTNLILINKHKPMTPPSTSSTPPRSVSEKSGQPTHKKLLPSTGTVISIVSFVSAVVTVSLALYILKKKKYQ